MSQVGIRSRFRAAQLSPRALAMEALALLIFAAVSTSAIGKAFTVADDIALTYLADPYGRRGAEVRFSPDGNYFAVWSERGRLDLNCVEDSLRFYRRQDAEVFMNRSDTSQSVKPVWIVKRSEKEGTVINDWRWLPDSSGVAYLEGANESRTKRLVLANLRRKIIEPLTSATEGVRTFDVRDRENYVYTGVHKAEREVNPQKAQTEPPAATVGTGHSLLELLFPDKDAKYMAPPPSGLWAVIKGKRFEVKQDGAPFANAGALALSPDVSSLVTILPVLDVPPSWETLYLPPYASMPFRVRHGELAHQYVRIDLKTGSIQSLTDAPIAEDAGWGGVFGGPSWSSDGRAVLLPGTFLSSPEHAPSSPCVAVVDFAFATRTCITTLKGRTDEKGYHFLLAAGQFFAEGRKDRVVTTTYDGSYHTAEYRHASGNTWQLVAESKSQSIEGEAKDLEVLVKEDIDQPPLLVAKNKQTSRVIWDPNPQLDKVELGRANVYKWNGKEGRLWKGGLYEPTGYQPGHRYPLVIQTHGFEEHLFRPSGRYPTGSAASSLAAAGIFVLQVDEELCSVQTPSEGACTVSSYESAVNQLVSEGKVDPERIGIIGFSRSCYWVMEALTASSIPFKAALVTDGWMMTYPEYIAAIDLDHNSGPRQLDTVIGASPFGEGLRQWLKRSPGFKLDKITAPLLVFAGEGRFSLLSMWDPYAGLRYLRKPTDLIILNSDEHVLTNPAMRLASQGGSVDWFRFWLQGYQDPAAAKAEQYRRWEKLCDMQIASNPGHPTFCVGTKH
jgi:dipeptidyl aminopeptidase/acylaminoacyl peptidase